MPSTHDPPDPGAWRSADLRRAGLVIVDPDATGGGNSFQPPQTTLVRLLDAVMPIVMRAYLRVRGRHRRS